RPIIVPIMEELWAEGMEYVQRFEDAAKTNTAATLDANEAQARGEMVRYGISESQVEREVFRLHTIGGGLILPVITGGWETERETVYGMDETDSPAVEGLQNAARVLLERRRLIEEKKADRENHRNAREVFVSYGADLSSWVPDERFYELDAEVTEMEGAYNEL